MSQPNAFIRSKLQDPAYLAKILTKIEGLYASKSNSFNVYYGFQKFHGEHMTLVDFSVPGQISFTYDAVAYTFLVTDIKIVKKIRARKYVFKVNVLTVTP
jgi:hypothetical protein